MMILDPLERVVAVENYRRIVYFSTIAAVAIEIVPAEGFEILDDHVTEFYSIGKLLQEDSMETICGIALTSKNPN
jgi:hypothetical protein